MHKPGGQTMEKGSATVMLLQGRIIACRLSGIVTGPVVKESMRQTALYAAQIREKGRRPLLLLDVDDVVRPTSEARSRAKALNEMDFERIAVSGGSRPIVMLGSYIARAAGMGGYTRFFRKEPAAMAWLTNGAEEAKEEGRLKRSVTVLLILLIVGGAIVGWILNVPTLTTFIPSANPMNPLAAVAAVPLALAIGVMSPGWRHNIVRRRLVFFAAFWGVVIGLLVVIRYIFHWDVHFNGNELWQSLSKDAQSSRAAPGAGISLVCLGIVLWLMAEGRMTKWRSRLAYGLLIFISLLAVAVLVGFSYNFNDIYQRNNFLSMPLPTAVVLLLAVNALITAIPFKGIISRNIKLFYGHWQAILVAMLLVLATGAIWRQSTQQIQTNVDVSARETYLKAENTIVKRLATYVDALNGYKGLFASSSDVAPAEFHSYFVNSSLATNYPGFSAFSYVAAVPGGSRTAFIHAAQARATIDYPEYKSFTIFPENTNPVHYPLLYVQPTETTRYGFDLGSEAVRRGTLEQARDEGKPLASGVIDLNASRGPDSPENPGFFISLPIYKYSGKGAATPATVEARRAGIQGFILAYFINARLFSDLFASTQASDVKFTLADTTTGKLLYSTTAPKVPSDAPLKESNILKVGQRSWQLNMYLSPGYGKSGLYLYLPTFILTVGLLLSALAGLLVAGQLRRRDQALALAGHMTEDLNNERNNAIALQRKDEAILSSIGDAVFAIDTKERITLFNEASQNISGFTAEEALGKPYQSVLHFEYEKGGKLNDDFIRRALKGHVGSMKNHTQLVRKDGSRVAVADSAAPIRDARGTLLGVIVVFRDVSREQELDRAKSEFVSLASHQLRTPLSAINWYGELLLSGDAGKLGAIQKEYVTEIYEGNQRMIDLVNSLLNVSRIDLGKLANQPSSINMKELSHSLQKELATTIESKHLKLVNQIQASLPTLSADPKLIRMVVQNLLSNAVKYTPENGSIHVTMRQATDEELVKARITSNQPYLFMSVTDTGYGIPKEQQSKIFNKLFRADNVQTLDVEGTGLGLYIVKQVIEKLGGKVWFTSLESVGTTFYVLLPFKTQEMASDTKEPSQT